ncbi:dihydrofolate synthase [Amycolatopsis acidicola]|uniref:tetrahydrofolate synthase n=2 Tax=Amycolatopsis acidicola TaxID=2596893 RepID=A0A5N0VNG7_9PSEU|nr:dihydrofolate synthase [Amycolatopsis acidicola]
MADLMARLGNPQHAVPVVHVTGTNGKTTTARIIDDLLRAAGLRVGRYTSPHLETPRERIALDGSPITAERFIAAYQRIEPHASRVDLTHPVALSFFEVMTATAFVAFAEAELDVAVVEVGMGGTWDATNVADGEVAVITPISLDHREYLGPDVAAIATEKAGIIKPGAVAIVGHQPPAALRRLGRRGPLRHVEKEIPVLARVPGPDGQQLHLPDYGNLTVPLLGRHQADNARTALAAANAFLAPRGKKLTAEAVRRTFAAIRSPGRLEPHSLDPPVFLDATHNPAGMRATVAALLEAHPGTRFTTVLAVLADKEVTGMLRAVAELDGDLVVTRNRSPRALPVAELASKAREVFPAERIHVHESLAEALRRPYSALLVTGSVVTAGEARGHLAG